MSENNQYEILWKKIRGILQASMSTVTYNTYISKLVPVDIDGTKIVLKTDTEFFANYIGKSLTEKIKEAFKKADTGITDFELVVEGNDEVYFTSVEEEDGEDCSPATLDPRFTFESSVAGKSNEFVFAAAKSVAQSPGANFNPLYIYGTSGLGKTHLLQSIAYIFDEPTRGIDVGAKAEIYQLIVNLAREGKGIIVISSELPEVMGISDRIIVMHEGRLSGEVQREAFSEKAIMTLAVAGE